MYTPTAPRAIPRWMIALAAIAVVVTLLALPPVRAAADQLLGVFRIQQVVFLPVDQARISQLRSLKLDGKRLFLAEPKALQQQAPAQSAASAADAATLAGFTPSTVTAFPGAAAPQTALKVQPGNTMEFQVDVQSAREVLALLSLTDVTLPDALGASPISAQVGAIVETRYTGANYGLTLHQGRSPTLTLPKGVEMAQLGRAFLRVLGSDAATADTLSRQIDWSSTLLFPFPANVSAARVVTVGDAQGLLVSSGGRGDRGLGLYWQRGDRFYMLSGTGRVGDAELLAAAESVR